MKHKSMNQYRVLYGSFLPLKAKRKFLFIFCKTNHWLARFTDGFTHVLLAEVIDDEFVVIIEPTSTGGVVLFRTLPAIHEWDYVGVLEVDVTRLHEYKLRKPLLHTCTTFCQYFAGIYLGCYLPQSLWNKLTSNDKDLKIQGIERVRVWEQQRFQ